MRSTFEVYTRADGRYGWRLLGGNGQIIAGDQGQGYENRAECGRIGWAIVRGGYAPADPLDGLLAEAHAGRRIVVSASASRQIVQAFEVVATAAAMIDVEGVRIIRAAGRQAVEFPSGGSISFTSSLLGMGYDRIVQLEVWQ